MPEKYTRRDVLKAGAAGAAGVVAAPLLAGSSSPKIPYTPKPPLGRAVILDKGDPIKFVSGCYKKLFPYVEDLTGLETRKVGEAELARMLDSISVIGEKGFFKLGRKSLTYFGKTPSFFVSGPSDALIYNGISAVRGLEEMEPSFFYQWKKVGDEGKLERVIAYMDWLKKGNPYKDFAVNYETYFDFNRNNPWIPPSDERASLTPETLRGETHLLGVEIPWTIDFRKAGWDVVDKSGIVELVSSI